MCGLGAALLLAAAASALADVYCVDLNCTNATPPFVNWATAATNIQDAVDAAVPGNEVVVANTEAWLVRWLALCYRHSVVEYSPANEHPAQSRSGHL